MTYKGETQNILNHLSVMTPKKALESVEDKECQIFYLLTEAPTFVHLEARDKTINLIKHV